MLVDSLFFNCQMFLHIDAESEHRGLHKVPLLSTSPRTSPPVFPPSLWSGWYPVIFNRCPSGMLNRVSDGPEREKIPSRHIVCTAVIRFRRNGIRCGDRTEIASPVANYPSRSRTRIHNASHGVVSSTQKQISCNPKRRLFDRIERTAFPPPPTYKMPNEEKRKHSNAAQRREK